MDDARAQLIAPFPATEVFVHTRQVKIELIDGGLLEQRGLLLNNFSHQLRLFGIRLHIALQHNNIGTQQQCLAHGHSGAYAKGPRLIAARCHHTTVAAAANDQWFAAQAVVAQAFYRDEKRVEVEVEDGAIGEIGPHTDLQLTIDLCQ